MIIPYTNMLVTAALLVMILILDTVSSGMLLNISGSIRPLPPNCFEAVSAAGSEAKSGIYQIQLPLEGWTHRPFYVYCLLDDNGGDPWLLIQRRQGGEISFNHNWNGYKIGFGNLATSFFIGLDKLHAITQVQINELQIELHDFDDTVKYANYDSFAVGDESEIYALNVLGLYSGTADDSLTTHHSGQNFSTYDKDNENWSGNCAKRYKCGWWYNNCHRSNLNGEYLNGTHEQYSEGIIWNAWHGLYYSLKYAHMAIRPRDSAEMRVYGIRKRISKVKKA
ncbi:ryncolin-1-like [Zeugodacus cucurbitae]|uniref:ryncolin-1-like n=1 Tax=Zeugodacus cucurbitae TaxID=28588 RepID=UPI0023D91D5A|nr:ryncolin-1-like [Zeugodacus cucurbitae]